VAPTERVILVTGASSGLGRAIAIALAADGARVYGTSRRATPGIDTDGMARMLTMDVDDDRSVEAGIREIVAECGRIDVLINNAGGLVERAPIESITDELFDKVLYLNVRSAMMCTGAAAQHMRKQGAGGSIINVTSVAARHGGGPGASLYAGSKGFVSTMTRGLAKELVKDKIRVNAVAPGVIVTPFHERYSTPQMLESFKATIPMNRLGTSDECAGAFLFLASEQMSGYMTGQVLEVNGGQYMP
jgi:3-oxoacyl-[acyl-carrier protein] reductase